MNIRKVNLSIETDQETLTIPLYSPVVLPPEKPKYILSNIINWGPLNNLPVEEASEHTYFVLTVNENGTLSGGSNSAESDFVRQIRLGKKKATFSIGGGTQNTSDITEAITNNSTVLVNNIISRINQFGYNGVTLDIENTSIPSDKIVEFIRLLRARFDMVNFNLIIGMYVQPYQINTVFRTINEAAYAIDWLSPMIYDFEYTLDELETLTNAWLPKLNGDKSKLLCGIAVNYQSGLDISEYSKVLDIVDKNGWKGIGIWNHYLYTEQWRLIRRNKWPVIQ